MADDLRQSDQGLTLPRTDDGLPSGAIAGGGIGGQGMDTSGNAQAVHTGSQLESGAGRAIGGGTGAYAQTPLSSGTLANDARATGAAGAAMAGMASGGTLGDAHGGSQARDGDISENRLIAADRVTGTAVYDSDGDRIGVIDNLMIDKITGEVAYAVMSFGGFLGIGERYHPLPWDVLTYDTKLGGYNVGMAAANLKDAPNYDRTELSTFGDRDYGSRVDDYYSTRRGQQGGLSGMTRTSAD